jgi:hypothetical protein
MQHLYQELLQLRRTDPVLRPQDRHTMQARALTPALLAVSWHTPTAHRWLLANFGATTQVTSEAGTVWSILLQTNASRFGGDGDSALVGVESLYVPARTAVFLASNTL